MIKIAGSPASPLARTAALFIAALGLPIVAGCAASGSATLADATSTGAASGRAASTSAAARSATPVTTDAQFCIAAQAAITGSKVPAVNTVYADYQAFVESKPAPRPLETRQYVWFEDESRTRPKMISCKMKTADHIRVEYGADQVGDDTSCAAINELTIAAVRDALTPAERRRAKFDGGTRVVLDPDTVMTNGPLWLEPYAMAYVAPDGALHLKSKGMKNDWLDPRLANAEARFKGTRYCHLAAPEYLRRVLLGEAVL